MKILVCPDSFKGTCSARAAAAAIARGVREALPAAEVIELPLADGGEGTVVTLCPQPSQRRTALVHDPLMRPIQAEWGILPDGTAVIETAAASGLPRLAPHERNPRRTTTYGTGELVVAALRAGCRRMILGLGGSATNDAGAGLAQALGFGFYDHAGQELARGLSGGQLAAVARIDAVKVLPAVRECEVVAACDVRNPLCGPDGAAAVFAPQKGATRNDIAVLDAGLAHIAAVIARDLGVEVREIPGAGAAGGLGAGCVAFLHARLVPGIDVILDALRFDRYLAHADLVITGEGRVDAQSLMGKALSGIVARAQRAGVPVVAFAGCVDESRPLPCPAYGIVNQGVPMEEACAQPEMHLARLAARVIRALRPGMACR